MNSFKFIGAAAALGLFAAPAMAQTTATTSHTTHTPTHEGSTHNGSMEGMSSKAHSMQMNHKGMSKKAIAACHKMSHARMMKARSCRGMMKNGKMMKHAM